ncbi:GerMN domain-containing protein [Arthrobacter sp. SAFR-179]|uniref:GerMN domain-containing protein n=1 Tax=Arthrobacter sp. SAFR-179 TaxID=3387279 RepID=UPI003F7C4DDA
MAKRRSRGGGGPGSLTAAAGCLALLLSACSAPLSQPQESSPPATAGTAAASSAPLALLPATMGGSTLGAQYGRAAGIPEPTPQATAAAMVPPVTSYFVMVDDGGRHGVRFGCNDSLVGSAPAGGAGDTRLKAAMGGLLDGEQQHGGLFNAVGGSRLKFLSGSFDGTTVTVYLAGTLKPGGTCDLPRIEAQLTQTALQAVGAIRADIYINGEALADFLKSK